MISVLYVDDEPAMANIFTLYMERDPELQVSTSPSAEDALTMIQTTRYDAIVSDYEMPGMNGIQLLQRVREISPGIPFIIFTGRGREEVAIESINNGADYYVKKDGDPMVQFAELTYFVRKSVELRESRQKYQRIFDSAIEGIYQISPRGQFLTANPAMAHILGYLSVNDLLESVRDTARQLWVDQEARRRYIRHLRDHGAIRGFECEFFKKDASRIWVSLNARMIRGAGGDIISSDGFLEDITGRKHTEQALRESEEMFRNPVEQSPVGVYLIQDDRFRYANPTLAGMLGYARDDIVGEPFEMIVSHGDLPRVRESVDRWLNGDMRQHSIVFRGQQNDGSAIDLEAYGSCMIYQDSPALCGTIIDVTQRRHLEEKIARSLREKETLIKEIHHRTKNNMQIITSLLKMHSNQISDPTLRQVFQDCENRIQSMSLVHENLLRSNDFTHLDIREHIRTLTSDLLAAYIRDEEISFSIDVDDIPMSLDMAIPCGLILNELVSNALKYAFSGRKSGCIAIGMHRVPGNRITLTVRDNGEWHPEQSGSRNALGLQMVDNLVKYQLEGTITFEQREGTMVTIVFPEVPEP